MLSYTVLRLIIIFHHRPWPRLGVGLGVHPVAGAVLRVLLVVHAVARAALLVLLVIHAVVGPVLAVLVVVDVVVCADGQ